MLPVLPARVALPRLNEDVAKQTAVYIPRLPACSPPPSIQPLMMIAGFGEYAIKVDRTWPSRRQSVVSRRRV